MTSVSRSANEETIRKCQKVRFLIEGLEKGVHVRCPLCNKSTPSDHRTNHLKHFLYNHLSEFDDKQTVFKYLNLSPCKTYNSCFERGITRAREKKIGNVSTSADTVTSSNTNSTNDDDSFRNHLPMKKRLKYLEYDVEANPHRTVDEKVPKTKERTSNAHKPVRVSPHLASCDSSKNTNIKRRASFPRKLERGEIIKYCGSEASSKKQQFNGSSNLSSRGPRSVAMAPSHPSLSTQGPGDASNIEGTAHYDKETLEISKVLLQLREGLFNDRDNNDPLANRLADGTSVCTLNAKVSDQSSINSVSPSSSSVPRPNLKGDLPSTQPGTDKDELHYTEAEKPQRNSKPLVETKLGSGPLNANSLHCHNFLNTSPFAAKTSAFTIVKVATRVSPNDKLSSSQDSPPPSPSAQGTMDTAQHNNKMADANSKPVAVIGPVVKVSQSPNHIYSLNATLPSTSVIKRIESLHGKNPNHSSFTGASYGIIVTANTTLVKKSLELKHDESAFVKCERKDKHVSSDASKIAASPLICPSLPSTFNELPSVTITRALPTASTSSETLVLNSVKIEKVPHTHTLDPDDTSGAICNDSSGPICSTTHETNDATVHSPKATVDKENHEDTHSASSSDSSCRKEMQVESESDGKEVESTSEEGPAQERDVKPELNIDERSQRLRLVLSRLTKENGLPCPFCNEASTITDRRNAHVEHFLLCHLNRDDVKETVFKSLGLSDSIRYNECFKAGMGRLGVRFDTPCDVSHVDNSTRTYPNACHESIVLGASSRNNTTRSSQVSPSKSRSIPNG